MRKTRILSVYKWATMGGVERVLLNRAHAIQASGLEIQYDVFFFHDSGGKQKFKEYLINNGLSEMVTVVDIINKEYDFIFSIDTPEILDMVDANKTFIECHTSYEKNRMYLRTLPSEIRGILVPSEHFKQSITPELDQSLVSKLSVLSNNVHVQNSNLQYQDVFNKTPILYVGRIDILKNVEELIKIVAHYNKVYGDKLLLILAGNIIDHEVDLEMLLKKYNVQQRTVYLPPLNFDKVWELLQFVKSQKGIFASASLLESFGLSVAEAMAFELPVLLLNNDAHGNLVNNDESFLFEKNHKENTIAKLLNLIENYDKHSELVKKYSQLLQDRFMSEFIKIIS